MEGRLVMPSGRGSISSLILLFLSFGLAAPALAQTYYVDSSRPYDTGDGLSWATAKKTIQAAINATTLPHYVWVRKGTYVESIQLRSDVEVYGGFDLGATQVTQRDTKPYATVIDASKARSGQPALHAVKMDSVANARIDGFTITGGVADTSLPDSVMGVRGGGVLCDRCTNCVIVNCTITRNSAEYHGGGVYCYYSNVAIRNCFIYENTSPTGGGISIEGGETQMIGCGVCGNQSNFVAGAYLNPGASMQIEGCTISANVVNNSGSPIDQSTAGIYFLSGTESVTVRNCIISGNASPNGVGGILLNLVAPQIINCTIVDNTSKGGVSGTVHMIQYANQQQRYPLLKNLILAGNSMNAPTTTGDAPTMIDCLQSIDSRTSYSLAGSPRFLMGPGGTLTFNAAVNYDSKRAVLIDAKARWTPSSLIGKLVIPDLSSRYQALVVDNTTTSLILAGLPTTWQAPAGRKYQFVDYHLGYGSAAIDAGNTTSAPGEDIEKHGRPDPIPGLGSDIYSNSVDLGAYEMQYNTPPRIRVAPALDPVDFGVVDIIDGPTPPRQVTLYNLGNKKMTFPIPGIRLSGLDAADFTTATSGTVTGLNPGTSCTVAVAFDPVAEGTKTAALLISTNDPAAPLTTVSLTGQGIIPMPKITKAPKTQTVNPNTTATFSIAATGRAPLTYQWYRNSTPLTDNERIAGSQTTTLTLGRVTQADEGAYVCKVTTPVGAATSSGGSLYVNPRITFVSPYGSLNPAPGIYIVPRGSTQSVTLTSTTVNAGLGTRHVCTGWTAPNLLPSSGASAARLYFYNVIKNTTVTLHWKTQYALTATADPPGYGTVAPESGWYDAGPLSLAARPCSFDSLFTGWSGALSGATASAALNLNAPASVTAHFAMRPGATGVVSISVRPPTVGWTLKDSRNQVIQGAGPARQTVAPGPVTLTWKTPLNYSAPATNPVLRDVPPGGEVSVLELFDPTSDAKRRQGNAIVRYLLGLTSDPAGLDLNGDGKVSIADLSRTF